MVTSTGTVALVARARNPRLAGAALAAAVGLFIVFVAGFAPVERVHDAAHDTRHAFAFPCH